MDYRNIEQIVCDLCGASDSSPLENKVQFGLPFVTVVCRHCGLVFINPRPKREELISFYINEYHQYYGLSNHAKSWNVQKNPNTKRGEKIYNSAKRWLRDADHILEIGAGHGGNLIGLHRLLPNSSIYAIEPGEQQQTQLPKHGVSVIGRFYDIEKHDLTKYQVILLIHILEHFLSPKSVLEKLHDESKNPLLIIIVPSLRTLRRFVPLRHYFLRIVHLFYFNVEVLTNLLRMTGWHPLFLEDKEGEIIVICGKKTPDKKVESNYLKTISDFDSYRKKINILPFYFKQYPSIFLGGVSRWLNARLGFIKSFF